MRKAALIVGIVFAIVIMSGALLKLIDFPGGGLLLVLGTGCFVLFALPLQLIYNIRRNKNGLRRAAHIVGLFGVWTLLLGLLYKAQSWPGAHVLFIDGAVITAIFGILFFVSSRKAEVQTEWFPGFSIVTVLVGVSLFAAWMETSADHVDIDTQEQQYQTEQERCKSFIAQTDELITNLNADGSWDKNDTTALTLHYDAMQVIAQIQQVKTGLVYESNRMAGGDGNNGKILRPEDIDVTTWYMVGTDPAIPTGHGLDVYRQLQNFRSLLPAQVHFAVPTSDQREAQEQWTKDNFYHATVLQALTVLTKVETEIYISLNSALEQRAYIEQ